MSRATVRRVGWGIGDQAFSSLTNFGLAAVVARATGVSDFGAFGLAFATYTLVLGVSRAITSEPLVIRKSAVAHDDWARAASASNGASLVIGLVGGAFCVLFGYVAGGSLGAAMIPLGMSLPGLLSQDNWRHAFFAQGSGSKAMLNDVVWAILMFPALAVFLAGGNGSIFVAVSVWGAAASAASLMGMVQSRIVPRPQEALRWWRSNRDLIPSLFGEVVVLAGMRQITMYGIAALAGLAAVGSIRGALLLLGPLNVMFMGVRIMAVPEAVRTLNTSVSRFRSTITWIFVGLSGVTAFWVLMLLLMPDGVGRTILGTTWTSAKDLIIPVGIADAATGGHFAGMIGLRAMAAVKESFRAKTIASLVSVVLVLLGAAFWGAFGAAWARALASGLGAWIFMHRFHRVLDVRPGRDVETQGAALSTVGYPAMES